MLLEPTQNIEEKVVKILAKKPGLTTYEILGILNESGRKYTYQGLYKELAKLRKNFVVIKTGQKFNIHISWAIELQNLVNRISKTHVEALTTEDIIPKAKKKKTWSFDKIGMLNNFWAQVLLVLTKNSKGKLVFDWAPHPWYHLSHTALENRYLEAMKLLGAKTYQIIGGKTYLDKWVVKYLEGQNIEYTFAKSPFDKEQDTYYTLIDQYLVTVRIDPVTTQKIEELYSNTKVTEDVDYPKMFELFNGEVNIKLTIENNTTKIPIIRKKFQNFFGITA